MESQTRRNEQIQLTATFFYLIFFLGFESITKLDWNSLMTMDQKQSISTTYSPITSHI